MVRKKKKKKMHGEVNMPIRKRMKLLTCANCERYASNIKVIREKKILIIDH